MSAPLSASLRRDLGAVESYATLLGMLIGAGIFKVTSDAWELTGSTVPVRSGLVFLRSPGAAFAPREPPGAAELESIRRRLLEAARAVASGRRTSVWPKTEPARCRELECGFLRRCHPEEVVAGT